MRITSRSRIALFTLLLAAAPASAQRLAATVPGPRETVAFEEILEAKQTNVYDLIRAHRPLWLHTRGAARSAGADVMVYLDGSRLGGSGELRDIPTAIVTGIQFMDAREATTRWGANHGNGAILVSTAPRVVEPARGTVWVPAATRTE